MIRKYMLSLCLAGALAFPASLVLACHLETASVELSCTQYKIMVKAVGATPTHTIHYTFIAPSTAGGPPLTISNTISVTPHSGDFTDSVTKSLSLAGNYDTRSLSGSASIISSSGQTENTINMTFPSMTLNCAPPS